MALITVYSYSLVVPATTNLFITAAGRHGYPSGTKSWQMELWFNSSLARVAGGSVGYTDTPNMVLGLIGITPGTYLVELKWSADSPMTLNSPTLVIQGTFK